MSKPSFLVQETNNKLLDLIANTMANNQPLCGELSLSKQMNTSRTTVRTVIKMLGDRGVIGRHGSKYYVLRSPVQEDYFELAGTPSSKEEQFECFFLSLVKTGKLHPGDRFSELDLARKSDCTTITVREFLIKFSHTGLIQKKPREQWQMVEFDQSFAQELISFRKLLEMASIRALLEKPIDDPVWIELKVLLADHKNLVQDMDQRYSDFSELDARLHRLIQSSSSNRFISRFFDIVTFVCHYHYQWDRSDEKERNKAAAHEHIDLITKLLSRDIDGAIISLERHLNTAQNTLMRSVYGLGEGNQ